MADIDVNKLANAKSKGKRPYFFDDPAVERVLSITMAVATELAVTRERLDTVERLLEDGVPVTKANIDSYRPDDDASRERQQWHADYIARILRIIHQELEALEDESLNTDPEKLADEFAAGE
ncbi:MAG: hypothetical protein RIC29_06235 [Rhodospirillaceae bacterium]